MSRPILRSTVTWAGLARRLGLAAGTASCLASAAGVSHAQTGGQSGAQTAAPSPTVVELFTSQGCSSCPPADALFGKLSTRPDLIVLTWAVDYWDYLGWKDTFAAPEYTRRQKDYARVRGDGQVYTPQAVIDGRAHVVGSRQGEVERAIKVASRDGPRPRLTVTTGQGGAIVEAGAAATSGAKAILLLATVQRSGEVAIGRGENKGAKVTYANIVRGVKPLGEWTGAAMTVKILAADLPTTPDKFAVVLLQQGLGGPILAAAPVKGP